MILFKYFSVRSVMISSLVWILISTYFMLNKYDANTLGSKIMGWSLAVALVVFFISLFQKK
jgi:hypothetical protein